MTWGGFSESYKVTWILIKGQVDGTEVLYGIPFLS